MKEKFKSERAKARSLATPAFPKKYIVVASLRPSPPIEIGRSVIAPMMGRKIR